MTPHTHDTHQLTRQGYTDTGRSMLYPAYPEKVATAQAYMVRTDQIKIYHIGGGIWRAFIAPAAPSKNT